jgi:O-antigen ligase
MTLQMAANMGPSFEAQQKAEGEQNRAWMLSPQGHAGWEALLLAVSSGFLLLFAIAGGALGARFQARARRPQV